MVFRVGDYVVGNDMAGRCYAYTTKDVLCLVERVSEYTIGVSVVDNSVVGDPPFRYDGTTVFDVNPNCFDIAPNNCAERIAEFEAERAAEAERIRREEEERQARLAAERERLRKLEEERLAALKRKEEERANAVAELISESERKYIFSNMVKLLERFNYRWTNSAINKIIDEWAYNKADLIRHFREHPNYLDRKFMIVFSNTYDREIDFDQSKDFFRWIIENVSKMPDSDYKDGLNNPWTAERNALEKILYYNKSKTVIDETAAFIDRRFPEAHIHAGEKTTRAVGKLCKLFGIDKIRIEETNPVTGRVMNRGYDFQFAKFADSLSPLQIVRHTVLSVNPLDYLTMSFGNSWASCHTIDKCNLRHVDGENYHGQYSSGTMSYMLDQSSMVLYTVSDRYTGNDFWDQDKITRQMFHWGEEKLIQGRLYPQSNDDCRDAYAPFREIAQRLISEMYEFPNRWTVTHNKNGERPASKYVEDYGTHYRDYRHYDGPTLSRIRNSENENDVIIGHDPICVYCGTEHDVEERIDCCHEYAAYTCHECGCVVDDDDVCWIDGEAYCRDCVTMCERCDEYIRNEDSYEVHRRTRWGDETHYVCRGCYEYYYDTCAECGEAWDEDDMYYTEDDGYVCRNCYDNYYSTCDECGDVYMAARMILGSDNRCRCRGCNTDFEEEFGSEVPARIAI